MLDTCVRCDKPYDLDEMDKRRGKPRRRRKDSRTTAYELTVRLSKEQRDLMGKAKYVRVVYAKNKREDLARQQKEFEEEVSRKIREAALSASIATADMGSEVSHVVRAYLKSRENAVVSDYCRDSLNITERYIDPTIGKIPYGELTRDDVERALNAIPDISRRLNEEKRRREEEGRRKKKEKQEAGEDRSGTHYPEFQPVRVAGAPTQHKVLCLLKLAGAYAVDKGLAIRNVADDKRLREQFPKNKPLVDNFLEDEARYIHGKIKELPLCAKKVQFQLVFLCGLRPCEMTTLIFDNVNLRDPNKGSIHIVKHLKTRNAAREIKLDPETTALLIEWKKSREAFAEESGVLFSNSWLVCCDDGQKVVYNTFKQRWMYFMKSIGMEHRRPYAMRHTFATMNARNNVDVKTLSTLMGHATPGFTLSVYAGYLESAGESVTASYLEYLESGQNEESSMDNDAGMSCFDNWENKSLEERLAVILELLSSDDKAVADRALKAFNHCINLPRSAIARESIDFPMLDSEG